MRSFLHLPLLLLVLSARLAIADPIPAIEIDQGLQPPGSGADLVSDQGVPQAGIPPIPYVIVTTRALRPAFLELGRERIRNGVRSAVRSLESLQAAYPVADDDADRVRRFLRDAHDVWGTRYVLIGGDSDVMPVRYVTTLSLIGERHFVSDWYFACLDGTWDADHDGRYAEAPDFSTPGDPGDQPDLVPELYLGRAPVSNLAEARRFVDKTIAYERRPVDSFENQTALFANRLAPFFDLAEFAELILPNITDDPAQQVTRLYESFDNPAWVPGALPETPPAVVDALDQGANVVFGFGAGSTDVMEAGDRLAPDPYLTVPDVLGLTNGDRAGHVFLLTSLVGAFDTPVSLAEAFIRAEHGGAVTVIAPTDITLALQSSFLTRRFVEVVFDEGAESIGEALVRARADAVGFAGTMVLTYELLGDPLLRVFHASPVAAATGGGRHGRTGITSATPTGDPRADPVTTLRLGETPAQETRRTGREGAVRFALSAPAPSPCLTGARIACAIPAELSGAALRATIHDLAGRTIRTLADRTAETGIVTLDWDLRNDRGERVGPGVYFVHAAAAGLSQTRRLVVTGGR